MRERMKEYMAAYPEVAEAFRFMEQHKGEAVLFDTLDEDGKFCFVIIKTLSYFSKFLSAKQAAGRAIDNAVAHRKSRYEVWQGKTLIISAEEVA